MDVPKAVGTEAGDVRVLDEVLLLETLLVVLVPVAPDGKDCASALLDGDDVGKRDLIFIFAQVPISVDLVEVISLVVVQGVPLVLGLLLLDVREKPSRLAQVNVPVEP